MKTEKHPYSTVVHYATGGFIDKPGTDQAYAEFSTLCGRTFQQGHDQLMQSGYVGAQNVTCKICRKKLDKPKGGERK